MGKRIPRAAASPETHASSGSKGANAPHRRTTRPSRRRPTAADARANTPVEATAPAFVPEDKAREMVEGALDAIVSLDPAGRVLEFNPAAERLFGYSRAEVLGRDLTELIIPADLREADARGLAGLVSGSESRWLGQRVELTARRRDGTLLPVELAMTRLHSCNPPCYTAWLRDISDRRLVEVELSKLAAFPRLSPQAIFELTPQGNLSYFNDAANELTRALGERRPSQLLPPGVSSIVATCLETGRSRLHYESVVAGRMLAWSFHPIPALQVVHAYAADHTEHKRATQQLREQAILLDGAQDAIVMRGLDHRILYWNRGAERVFGWCALEVIGRSAREIFEPGESERHLNALRLVLEQGEWSGELRYPAKNGVAVDLQSRWTLLRDDDGRPKSILVIGTDITQRKKLETEFLRAQRLESVGALATGIAHDLNNILAPILMSVELLRENAAQADAAHMLETLRASVQRGAEMVRQILAFTRGQDTEHIHLCLRQLIAEIARIAAETFPRNIRIHTDTAVDLWPMQGHPTQIHQVLMNLAVNARDAMPEGGRLELGAENVCLEADAPVLPAGAAPGAYLRILVSDTGTGIAPELLPKIWEPFFTLKPDGCGTGLGLSTVQRIVMAHGGFVHAESTLGQGSRFSVYLPACSSAKAKTAVPDASAPRGRGQQILLIDDEQAFQEIARSIFVKNGYRVLTANDGAEAVELFSRHRGEIDLVMTDMVMPCLDGAATIRALRRMAPNVPILAASGLSENETQVPSGERAAFLSKPFTSEAMLQTVAHLLAGSGGEGEGRQA